MPVAPKFLVCLLLLGLAACASERKRAPQVPEETQHRSEELYGQQAQSMGALNQTSAEQAAARHEARTRPAERESNRPSDSRDH